MKVRLLFLAIVFGVVTYLLFPEEAKEFLSGSRQRLQDLGGRITNTAQELANAPATGEVVAPGPLRSDEQVPQAVLTVEGVVRLTNEERVRLGLASLTVSEQLSKAAAAKVQDMFDQQYFAHVAPSGKAVGDFMRAEGYEFIVAGENLALGGFRDDAHLVQSWMASPGHRANIVSTRFREIGVAVGKGMYQNRQVWLAVQMFGLPLSACPQADADLRTRIDAQNEQIHQLSTEAEARKRDLDDDDPQTQGEVDERNRKVDEYNALVARINALVEDTQRLVAEYNAQVETLKTCAEG